ALVLLHRGSVRHLATILAGAKPRVHQELARAGITSIAQPWSALALESVPEGRGNGASTQGRPVGLDQALVLGLPAAHCRFVLAAHDGVAESVGHEWHGGLLLLL